jgi:hypothetical protein
MSGDIEFIMPLDLHKQIVQAAFLDSLQAAKFRMRRSVKASLSGARNLYVFPLMKPFRRHGPVCNSGDFFAIQAR